MNLNKSIFRKRLIYVFFIISLLPILLFFHDTDSVDSPIKVIANILGYLGGIILLWQFFLGIRGVVKRITSDYDWSLRVHTFLGISGAIFVFSHPILESLVYSKSLSSILLLNFSSKFETQISYGKISLILFLFIWFTSAVFRKLIEYRIWLNIHYLSYPLLFFTLIHPFIIGSFFVNNVIAYYYWLSICGFSILFMFIKLLDTFNISYSKFRLIEIKKYENNIFTLKYLPIEKKIIPNPGEYFYIKTNFIGESHPFSVLEFNKDTGEIVFGIKDLGKYTHSLALSKVNDVHYLDGSFGEFTVEGQNSEPKVIFAGGIGVTPFYEFVKKYSNSNTNMFYANPNIKSALYRNEFKKILGNRYFDFVSDEKTSEENVICSLITVDHLKSILSANSFKLNKFFICGSPRFMNNVISCLTELGVSKNQIYIEEFGY